MTVTVEGKIMKVGNSLVLTLPKVICDNYNLIKGNSLNIAMTENGLFIPAKQNESDFIQKEIENALKSVSSKRGQK